MSDFRFKLKKPGMIQNFDDSDLSDCLSSTESSSPVSVPPAVKSQAVLPKSVPNHLLLVSILEQLCHMYTKDSKQAQDIFYSICNQLSNANVVSPLLILDEMSSLRTQYRLSVHKMMMAAIHKSNKGLTIGFPGSKSYALPAIAYSLPSEPSSRPEDMVNQTSRYKSEFVEMKTIGKGGFGSVFQSRNKLDGNLYAVKKVKFKHSKPEVWYKVLREVKALACLQHYNVVGYNAAWLEYEPIDLVKADVTIEATIGETNGSQSLDSIIFQDSQNGFFDYKSALTSLAGPKIKEITSDISETDSEISSFTNDFSVSSQSHRTTDIVKFSTKKSVFETKFQTDLTSSRYIESQSTFSSVINNGLRKNGLENKTGRRVEFSLSTEFSDMNIERPPRYGRSISCDPHATGESPVTLPADRQAFVESAFSLKQSVTLYIQMELCDISLKEWLQKRNYACANEEEFIGYQDKNMIIFRQMLKGVDFIHSQGIIHRDLKPRNIFLIESSQRIHVKIGDFGLATDEVTSPSSDLQEPNLPRVSSSGKLTRSESNVSDHTSGVGTSTYAAPEQLRGSLYNTKSDIYSLGVVLYELFMQFKTESERIRSLDDLRKGIIYEKIFKYWPAQAHCIQQMTMHNPDKRPSISDLLHGELFLSKDQIIGDLKATNNLQQKEIERLNKLLAESYKTIDQLTSSVNPFMGTS